MTDPWTDSSLSDPKKDELERGPFVKMVASLIENLADSNDSTVLGLVGPWGSGKTTVLNYITAQLDESINVVHFNPWSFDDERLQAELYSAILAAFPDDSRDTLREKAFDLVRRSAPALKAIPLVGVAAAETLREFMPAKSWDSVFDDLAINIKEASRKVLVVVDDVDRLLPNDLLLLMKTIRLLGRFPRVNYLLAYDRASTIKTLGGVLGGTDNAEVYLEKIVQYPLDLPEPQQQFLQKIVKSYLEPVLNSAFAGMNGGQTATIRFEEFYGNHMWTFLTTPRACRRYAMQAITFLSLAKGDVDPSDFFALTFLRLSYPDLYKRLPVWVDDLSHDQGYGSQQPTAMPVWRDRMKSCGYEAKADELIEALTAIFPRLTGTIRSGDTCPETFDYPVEDTRIGPCARANGIRTTQSTRAALLTICREGSQIHRSGSRALQAAMGSRCRGLQSSLAARRHGKPKTSWHWRTSSKGLPSSDMPFKSNTLKQPTRHRSMNLSPRLWETSSV
ncbi:KAP family P-loop NTPase fold protein [Arthrobacter humicola]